MNNAVPIDRKTASFSGSRGLRLTLPKVWIDDLDIAKGADLGAYSNPEKVLCIAPDEDVPDGFVKIHNYRIGRKYGAFTICLPQSWVEASRVKQGDKITIYRDKADRLYLVKESA